jgi:hypothetical protein
MPNRHREGKVITEPSEVPESRVRWTPKFSPISIRQAAQNAFITQLRPLALSLFG